MPDGGILTKAQSLSRRRLLILVGATSFTVACGEQGGSRAQPVESVAPGPPSPKLDRPVTAVARQTVAASDTSSASSDGVLRPLTGYGFQAHMYNQDRRSIVDRTRQAGFGWLKQQVEWRQTEPIEKGGFDWRELDKVVAAVSRAGLRILLSVVQAPEWALGDRAHGPPGDPLNFEDFMRAMSSRYRGRVHAYELWNEANLSREWGYGRIDAGGFVELMLAGHRGVKAVSYTHLTLPTILLV